MKNDKFYSSIVFKLITAVVVIFIAMMTFTNYMINQRQIQMTEDMLRDIKRYMPAYQQSIVVTVNNAHLQSTADFRIFTFVVVGMVLVIGSLIFAIIINKILQPLKDLTANISRIDIDKPETFEENLLVAGGSTEIEELSRSFNVLMNRIYRDYRKQKDFSSNVAHELRTPVAVMMAQVDVFKRKTSDPMTLDFIEKMDASLDKLTNLIEAVLMFSKKQSLNISDVNISGLVDEIIFDLEDRIGEKKLVVNTSIDEDLSLKTDDALLQRLLFNIIENAVKYNVLGGSIDINASRDKSHTIIDISDTGIGMSDGEKQKIFDLFYQVDSSRNGEGFGIGLSLSQQIADTLGAKIKVADNKAGGSRFLIIFDHSL